MTQTFSRSRRAGLAIGLGIVLLAGASPASAGQGPPTSTKTRSVERAPQPAPHVTNVRTGQHARFDRVVFDLEGGAPGYEIGYVREVREDGSGKVVEMRGHLVDHFASGDGMT